MLLVLECLHGGGKWPDSGPVLDCLLWMGVFSSPSVSWLASLSPHGDCVGIGNVAWSEAGRPLV